MRNSAKRILWLVIFGFVAVCAYFTIENYLTDYKKTEQTTLLRLEGIAQSVALQVDGDLHRKIQEKNRYENDIFYNQQDTDYYKIHHTLRMNAEGSMLNTPIYTMVYDSMQKLFKFVVTSDDAPYYYHPYKSFPKKLFEEYKSGGVLPVYTDMYGTWLSAFSPVRDVKGRPVAIVMVDESFDNFNVKARKEAMMHLFYSLCIILPVIFVLIWLIRRLVLKEDRLKNKLQDLLDKNLEISKELELSYQKLTSLDELRKEMMANISHDLRTPLTNLLGYVETLQLKQKSLTPDERQRYFAIAQKEGERLRKMIEDLFELSKLESNQVQLHMEPFSVSDLLHDIAQKYDPICRQKNIFCSVDVDKKTPWVMGDIKLLDRVLQNLFDNAIKHNRPADNELTGKGWITASVHPVGDKVRFAIINSSAAISEDDIKKLFDRYFKIGNTDTSTGLGLAIVKKILNLHKSPISVQNDTHTTSICFDLLAYKK